MALPAQMYAACSLYFQPLALIFSTYRAATLLIASLFFSQLSRLTQVSLFLSVLIVVFSFRSASGQSRKLESIIVRNREQVKKKVCDIVHYFKGYLFTTPAFISNKRHAA
jgi:uncharacterized membrane protein